MYNKKKIFILSSFPIFLSVSYAIYHSQIESKISSITPGYSSKLEVERILGKPKFYRVNLFEDPCNGNFKQYKSSNLDRNCKEKTSICTGAISMATYKGHSCFYACPRSFEDNITIYYNQSKIVCRIERYGL